MKKKLIISLMVLKKFIFLYFLFYSPLNASGTYSNVDFNDYEENATLYLVNNYSYQDFKNLRISATTSKNIINGRVEWEYETIWDIDDISGISKKQLHYLKQESHLIDWNKYTDKFGMTLHQTNFIYALTGVLIGFTFMFFSIYAIMGF